MIDRAFSPYGVLASIPGALPQAGMTARRWRWKKIPTSGQGRLDLPLETGD